MVQHRFKGPSVMANRAARSFHIAALAAAVLLVGPPSKANAQIAEASPADSEANWLHFAYYQELTVPADSGAAYFDCLMGPHVFDKARVDLGDLRLVDATGHEVPYALRVREPVYTDQVVSA